MGKEKSSLSDKVLASRGLGKTNDSESKPSVKINLDNSKTESGVKIDLTPLNQREDESLGQKVLKSRGIYTSTLNSRTTDTSRLNFNPLENIKDAMYTAKHQGYSGARIHHR